MAKTSAKTKTIPKNSILRKPVPTGRPKAKATPAPADAPEAPIVPLYRTLHIGIIFPSALNPRRRFDDESLAELASSIVANGMLQPILVRPLVDEHIAGEAFEVICGERRARAVRLAVTDGRLPKDYEIPARIRACSDEELVLLAATENLSRQDMDPLDEAEVFKALSEHVTHAPGERAAHAVARLIGISERTVFKRMQLLRLAPELQEDLRERKIDLQQAAAYALGDHETQRAHRATAATHEYQRDADAVRRTMTGKRFETHVALFDLASYPGEILEDVEEGLRYFADTTLFVQHQETAIAARIAALKERHRWVLRIESREAWSYRDVEKKDADAGAVCYLNYLGEFKVKAPVITPGVFRHREEQSRRDRDAAFAAQNGDDGDDAEDGIAPAKVPGIRGKLEDALAFMPRLALAAAIAVDLRDSGIAPSAAVYLAPFAAEIKMACVVPASTDLADVIDSLDEEQLAKLYRILAASPTETLVALYAAQHAADLACEMMFHTGNPTPLGTAFAEPGLFETPAAD